MIVGILLAAGTGSRFGRDKLLAPLGDATVGALSARALRGSVDRGVAVVRTGDEPLVRLLEAEGFEILSFPRAGDGLGASLAFGVSASSDADGWLIALADMPFIRRATISALVSLLAAGALIAAPIFEGRRGHPVGFGRALLPDLLRLRGDQGARSLVADHASEVALLQCDDPGVLLDVDSPSDLLPDVGATNRQ